MNKNTHLEHPEDLLLQQGLIGVKNILHYFQTIIQWFYGDKDNLHITVKYDGAPAVVFGSHPTMEEQIFVSTKSFFNKIPLLATSNETIMMHFNKAGKGPYKPLLALLDALIKADVEQVGIFQGDILYTPETLVETQTHYEIKHNTLTYKVDKTSALGKSIAKAPIGLVVHTQYNHITGHEYSASFEPQFERVLNMIAHPTIWHPPLQPFIPTTIKHASVINNIMKSIEILSEQSKNLPDIHRHIEANFSNPKAWFETLQKIINKAIREEKTLPTPDILWESWKTAMKQLYTSKKTFNADDINNPCKVVDLFDNVHYKNVIPWLQWYIDVANCKDSIVALLHSLIDHPGLEVYIHDMLSTHEGFVASNESEQWVIKLVKRSEFSHANFTLEKPWEKK